jgi:hypothetical protein
VLEIIKYGKFRAGLLFSFHTVLRNHLLFQNSSVNICVLMDLLNAQRTSQMCVRDKSKVSTTVQSVTLMVTYKLMFTGIAVNEG